MVAYVLSAFYR